MARRPTLEETIALLQATIDATRDGILVVDANKEVVLHNRRFLQMFGLTEDVVRHGGIDRLFQAVAPQLENLDELTETSRAIWTDPSLEVLDAFRFKDGRIFERFVAPHRIEGQVVGRVASFRDVTAATRSEQALRQAQKMEAIGRLAGGIAHDLNNALTAIAGYAELALGQLEPQSTAAADVEEIRKGAERAGSVTRQLLAFSRKELFAPRLFDLNDTILSLGRMLGRLLGEDIQIETDLARPLPAILGDPGQVEQAVINLALNARDAMRGGGRLTLSTSVEHVDETTARANAPMTAGDYITLRVSDTGHGMSAETQARIFEPFFTTKEIGQGTGLGLTMVYGTLKQIGGFIFVDSAVDAGTTFRLYFRPAASADRRTAAPETAPAERKAETVLIAEDEGAVRNLVTSTLNKDGYHLLVTASAEEALEVAERQGYEIDLLLTDAIMPGKSGIDLAHALTARRPGLRVIVMSGYTEETLRELDERVELLQKPFTPRDLRRRVRESLDKKGA